MPTLWDKLDDELSSVYSNYLRGAEARKLHVLVLYSGDVGELSAVGLEMVWNDGAGRATGALRMEDVERVAMRPEVIRICYSRDERPALTVSIPDIHANQVWTLASGAFSGATGNGVLIGVIDTGIDFNHDFFMSSLSPKTTRILRIWDHGLIKTGAETQPAKALLHPGTPGTYGVEYTQTQINSHLRNVPGSLKIRHRDCAGHGTHVASIAAGNGRTAFTHVGVAPKAELIIVKILNPETRPKVSGVEVGYNQRFMDAVHYVRGVAAAAGKPFVINYSVGESMGPHDGLTESEIWLANEFRPANSAGKIFVTSAGNDGDNRQHGTFVFGGAGSFEIPFELYDDRTNKMNYDTCRPEDSTKSLELQFYYPTGNVTVAAEFKPEGATAFTAGPTLGGAPVTGAFSGRNFTLTHKTQTDVLIGGATIPRNVFAVQVTHHPVNGHLTGTYTVRLIGTLAFPVAVTAHVWCYQARDHGLKLSSTLPIGVTAEDRFLIGVPSGAENVITVACYSARNPAFLAVPGFSSRGPLARHGVGGTPPFKPDLGAPGYRVNAANSTHVPTLAAPVAGQTIDMSGTSMSSPHVAGTVALMLEKNPNLTSAQVLSTLQTFRRIVPTPVPEEVGAGRLDAKDAFDNTP